MMKCSSTIIKSVGVLHRIEKRAFDLARRECASQAASIIYDEIENYYVS